MLRLALTKLEIISNVKLIDYSLMQVMLSRLGQLLPCNNTYPAVAVAAVPGRVVIYRQSRHSRGKVSIVSIVHA